MSHPPTPSPTVIEPASIAQVRSIDLAQPLTWLRRGWIDMLRSGWVSLLHGAL